MSDILEDSALNGLLSFRGSAEPGDARVEIAVAEDAMAAIASVTPAIGDGAPLLRATVEELLARIGVVAGILPAEIDAALEACNLERRPLRGLTVARGSLPVDEVPEHAELDPRLHHSGPLVAREALHADFRALASLPVVKKGQTLAIVRARVEGQAGSDVRGTVKQPGKRSVETAVAGKNVALESGRLVAQVDGMLGVFGEGREKRLDVEEVLLIHGGVDYHTGNIVFPGDVVIDGQIGEGFKVWSGASILCKSTMDAFDVNAKKDLVCAQGIIGRRRAQVRVGGKLSSKFIQNCKVAVRGDILVPGGVVGSQIFCLGAIELGDRGVFMAGEAWAVHGLRCGRLGNEAHQRTIVHAGTDFTVKQRLEGANERLRVLAAQEKRILEEEASHPAPRLEKLLADIRDARNRLSAIIGNLISGLDADERAVVEVRGDIFPGVVIEICRLSIVIEEKMKACRFRLDPAAGRILVERAGTGAHPAGAAAAPEAAQASPKPSSGEAAAAD